MLVIESGNLAANCQNPDEVVLFCFFSLKILPEGKLGSL